MSKFSKTLKNKAIAYFEQRHGLELSDEQVEAYLNSYAQLYMNISEGSGRNGEALQRPPSRP